jgi:hypothetical protein
MGVDKNGSIQVDVFITVAKDHDIVLSDKDKTYLK